MSTRYPGTRAEKRALDAWIKLNRAIESVSTRLRQGMEAAGMTHGQFAVLEVLRYVGPLKLSEISRRVLRSQSNLTTVVDNLEREGWVERQRGAEDRRVVTVSLTKAGQRVIDRYMPEHVAQITEALGVLPPDEQDVLGELCKRLGLGNAGDG